MNARDILISAEQEAASYDDDFEPDSNERTDNQNRNQTLNILRESASEVNQNPPASKYSKTSEANSPNRSMNVEKRNYPDSNKPFKQDHEEKDAIDRIESDHVKNVPDSSDYRTGSFEDSETESEHSSDSGDEDNLDGDNGKEEDDAVEQSCRFTFLLSTIFKGDIRECRKILAEGISLKKTDIHGWSAFHWAASKGNLDILMELLEKVKNSNLDVKKMLNKKENITGYTPLHLACSNGHLGCVELLIQEGASLKRRNRLKERPLDCVAPGAKYDKLRDAISLHVSSKLGKK